LLWRDKLDRMHISLSRLRDVTFDAGATRAARITNNE
jgi:hypothetical protein